MQRTVSSALVLAVGLGAGAALAQDEVTVPDTSTSFPVERTVEVDGEEVPLVLTGVGLREKIWFNVYSIASYTDAEADVATIDELERSDDVKVLHIIMERSVGAGEVFAAFRDAIRANVDDADERFGAQLEAFERYFGTDDLDAGHEVVFTHVPETGVRLQIDDREPVMLEGVDFSRAVWGIYFGPTPVQENMKESMADRLGRAK